MSNKLKSKNNPLCYIDFCQQDYDTGKIAYLGRVLFELRKDIVPKTAENFRALCTGEMGVGVNGKPLHFKGNVVHRVVNQFCVQFGDITRNDGTGGESIYQSQTMQQYFDDENFILPHEKYCLSMANSGKNRNSSQCFVYYGKENFLDKKHVVFGKVVHGFNICDIMNSYGIDHEGSTLHHLYIARSGQLKPDQADAFYAIRDAELLEKKINESREL